ncbi:class I SAM-dependent methyltransferase [Salinarimonas sp.]|uniref:class I SAM-dependent methyltransferase n=1 Tax=Salinarimonas sp. TaxID=2766526 RepID=UPI00391AB618
MWPWSKNKSAQTTDDAASARATEVPSPAAAPAIAIEEYGPTSIFRRHQNKFLRDYCAGLGARTIINLGAKPDAGDKEGATYEAYFPGADFRTLDLSPVDHPRHIQDDLHVLATAPAPADLVLAMSVIEHIDRPWRAADKIASLVRPGGHLYIAMPFFYPIHEGAHFGDHWRCTPSAMGYLFDMLEVVRSDWYPTAITAVRDRANYWNEPNSCGTGFSMLMRKSA